LKPSEKKDKENKKVDNDTLRNKELKNFQKKVDEFFNNLSEPDLFSTPSDLINDFEEHITSAAVDVAPAKIRQRPDWFTEAEELLMQCIDARNQAFKNHLKHPSTENHQALKEARHTLLREKRKAKRQWQYEYASKCKKNDFCLKPKDAWKMVFSLMEGFSTHHRIYRPTNFKHKNGVEAKSDSENANVLNSHFNSLFNSQVSADPTVLDSLPQHDIKHEYGTLPNANEIKNAIKSMPYDKSPGQSGLSTDMIKNLPPRALNYYVKLIQQFWQDPDIDFSSWHVILLKVLYKGKGDPQDPNNSRGIALKETSAKILSVVVARRLLKRLKEVNPSSQFGHVGCQEAQHTIKRALLLRRQHGLESYAVFVDLVKAFDTVNHQLLYLILAKYGLPPPPSLKP
jgi:hypothetical protein